MKKKKKGFTLIELIAVIAILAILGAVLVPKILGYQNKAKRSNIQTSAKTIVHAIQAYNADKTTAGAAGPVVTGAKICDANKVNEAVDAVNVDGGGANSTIKESGDSYTALSTLTVAQLVSVADGNFTFNGTTATATGATASIED